MLQVWEQRGKNLSQEERGKIDSEDYVMKSFNKKKDKLMFNIFHATHETSRFKMLTSNLELFGVQRINAIHL
jgi:hypothetical protein